MTCGFPSEDASWNEEEARVEARDEARAAKNGKHRHLCLNLLPTPYHTVIADMEWSTTADADEGRSGSGWGFAGIDLPAHPSLLGYFFQTDFFRNSLSPAVRLLLSVIFLPCRRHTSSIVVVPIIGVLLVLVLVLVLVVVLAVHFHSLALVLGLLFSCLLRRRRHPVGFETRHHNNTSNAGLRSIMLVIFTIITKLMVKLRKQACVSTRRSDKRTVDGRLMHSWRVGEYT